MKSLPAQQSSGTTATAAAIALAAASFLFAGQLRSEPRLVILAGAINAFLFFFATMALGNLKKSGEVGWIDVIVAMTLALVSASVVHRIAVTTTFLMSVGLLFYLTKVGGEYRTRIEAALSTKKK